MAQTKLSLTRAQAIYRAAVDPSVLDTEGEAWWSAVHAEMARVVAAPSVTEAAKIIDWWHNDWSAVGDTPRAAAQRIRAASRAKQH